MHFFSNIRHRLTLAILLSLAFLSGPALADNKDKEWEEREKERREVFKEQEEEAREWEKDRREAIREAEKDRREAIREAEKDRREAIREAEKDRREAAKERRKERDDGWYGRDDDDDDERYDRDDDRYEGDYRRGPGRRSPQGHRGSVGEPNSRRDEAPGQRLGYAQGYRDGFDKGREDTRKNRSRDVARRDRYEDADIGYKREYGDKSDYQAVAAAGVSDQVADLFLEMGGAVNDGRVAGTEPRTGENTTPTSLEEFARRLASM